METEINEIKEMIVQDQLLEAIRLSLEKNFLLVFHDELLIIQSNLTELLRRENIGVLETSHYLIQKKPNPENPCSTYSVRLSKIKMSIILWRISKVR